MQGMRQSTEQAALRIGDLLKDIVNVATTGNNEVKESLSRFVKSGSHSSSTAQSDSATISETIQRQSELISGLVSAIQECFDHQLVLSQSASSASQKVSEAAEFTDKLMARSRMLALNVRIEANRLGGEEGSAFATLAEEMKNFSDDVADANGTILESISSFSEQMPALEAETKAIGQTLSDFRQTFDQEMETVRQDTDSVCQLLEEVLAKTEARNSEIVSHSHATLSHLQFQDPVSQGLQRAEHDINKFLAILEGQEVDDSSLADIVDDVGHDGTEVAEAGEVMMF